MMASNYDDVLHQLQDAGLILPNNDLRIGTHKPVRVFTQEGGRERRGWYLLKEWSPSIDRLLIVGSYGIWHGNDNGAQKIALPKDDTRRITPEQRDALKKAWAEQAKAAEHQRADEAAAAAEKARRMWARLQLEGDSPYLNTKGVGAYGLKFTPNNTAVLPLVDTGGKIHGLQFLRSTAQAKEGKRPSKEFWPVGLGKKGHFHLLGHQPHWIVLVAEGYATAASLHAATGYPVACAFDAGNLKPVAEALRKRYKRAKILICADDDCFTEGNPGVTAAGAAALAVGGEWLAPTFGDNDARREKHEAGNGKLTDFNDLHTLEGLATITAQVARRLDELKWSPPALRAVPSHTGGRGDKLRPLQHLDELLERFALVFGGNGAVFDHQEHCLLALTDVRNVCIRADIHKAWMEHADRQIVRQTEVGFDPAGTDANITCNLWGGWPTEPKAGACTRLLDHLRWMCSGEANSQALYEWVLRWCAYPLQHPGAKMKTTIVVHGGQGGGKNIFFETVMGIYGPYGRLLDQDALVDKHNDWASRKLFLIADEVVAQAHRFEQKNKLKTLVTGTWIRINPKHIAAYDEANHVNLVFLSNEAMPVVLEEDDRRHCVIWTPLTQPESYYIALAEEVESGGIAALHDYLLHLDLGNFNPHTKPPVTAAKNELIDLAQDSPVDFVDELFAQRIAGLKPMPGKTTDWYAVYKAWCSLTGVHQAPIKRFLNAIFRRRGFQSVPERFRDGASIKQQRLLVWGLQPPEGVSKQEWLGDALIDFGEALSRTRNRGAHDDM
jgi:putative DNA primase/helicase